MPTPAEIADTLLSNVRNGTLGMITTYKQQSDNIDIYIRRANNAGTFVSPQDFGQALILLDENTRNAVIDQMNRPAATLAAGESNNQVIRAALTQRATVLANAPNAATLEHRDRLLQA